MHIKALMLLSYRSKKKHQIVRALPQRKICAGTCITQCGYACIKMSGTSRSNTASSVMILVRNSCMLGCTWQWVKIV